MIFHVIRADILLVANPKIRTQLVKYPPVLHEKPSNKIYVCISHVVLFRSEKQDNDSEKNSAVKRGPGRPRKRKYFGGSRRVTHSDNSRRESGCTDSNGEMSPRSNEESKVEEQEEVLPKRRKRQIKRGQEKEPQPAMASPGSSEAPSPVVFEVSSVQL